MAIRPCNSHRMHRPARRSQIASTRSFGNLGPEFGKTAPKAANLRRWWDRSAGAGFLRAVEWSNLRRLPAINWSWRRATSVPMRVFNCPPPKPPPSASPMQNGTRRKSLRVMHTLRVQIGRNSRRCSHRSALSAMACSLFEARAAPQMLVFATRHEDTPGRLAIDARSSVWEGRELQRVH